MGPFKMNGLDIVMATSRRISCSWTICGERERKRKRNKSSSKDVVSNFGCFRDQWFLPLRILFRGILSSMEKTLGIDILYNHFL